VKTNPKVLEALASAWGFTDAASEKYKYATDGGDVESAMAKIAMAQAHLGEAFRLIIAEEE
jgi:protein involved in polysaccharide export with SLBB domain